jgi:hypothetical protein
VGVTKTVNFDEREVAEIKQQSGFGKATVEEEGTGDGMDQVD